MVRRNNAKSVRHSVVKNNSLASYQISKRNLSKRKKTDLSFSLCS